MNMLNTVNSLTHCILSMLILVKEFYTGVYDITKRSLVMMFQAWFSVGILYINSYRLRGRLYIVIL